MPRAVYLCTIGCMADCRHGLPCVIFMIDAEHPHPMHRGHEAHVAVDDDGMVHSWDGKAGRCRIEPLEEED